MNDSVHPDYVIAAHYFIYIGTSSVIWVMECFHWRNVLLKIVLFILYQLLLTAGVNDTASISTDYGPSPFSSHLIISTH